MKMEFMACQPTIQSTTALYHITISSKSIWGAREMALERINQRVSLIQQWGEPQDICMASAISLNAWMLSQSTTIPFARWWTNIATASCRCALARLCSGSTRSYIFLNLVTHMLRIVGSDVQIKQGRKNITWQKVDSLMTPGSGCFSHVVSNTEQLGTPTSPPCTQ